ncbi:MAG: hypothetical protein VXW65_10355 [Pseudomonadota bacterium]|nr:hypothetical protein [Pseudomonadota bacterium]
MYADTTFQEAIQLTPLESQYASMHPDHAALISRAKAKVFAASQGLFGVDNSQARAQAFQMCYLAALLVRDLGYTKALEFMMLNESAPSSSYKQRATDMHNSRVGLDLGRTGSSDHVLSQRVVNALHAKQLQILA